MTDDDYDIDSDIRDCTGDVDGEKRQQQFRRALAAVPLSVATLRRDYVYSIAEIDALLNDARINRSAFWAEAAGGDMVPMTGMSIRYCVAALGRLTPGT